MDTIELKLENYVGPLDVLLHLIQKLEVDIYDIPIFEVTTQYMKIIRAMKELELEVAGEYLVLASTLMAIKSKMLLPTEEYLGEEGEILQEEDGVDPRQALVEQLLEYRKFKFAANVLKEKQEERELFYTKAPMDLWEYKEEEKVPDIQYNSIDLFLAFHQMLEKRKRRQSKETVIESETITIDERMDQILYNLGERVKNFKDSKMEFSEFFEEDVSKSEVITSFMAILELMKKGQISIKQENNYAPIYIHLEKTEG
jgi:segregation and condensation protein A